MPIDDYAALKDVPAADVLISGTHAATLTRGQRDTITFRYDPTQLKLAGPVRTHSVSWSLPAGGDATPVVTTAGAVPAFFAGLLPEGVRLGAVVASTKTSIDDHLTLLIAVGSDTIGNVTVVPTGSTPEVVEPAVDVSKEVDFHSLSELLAVSLDVDPVALSGVQPKVSTSRLTSTARSKSGAAILKLGPPQFPRIAENEHFFMTAARACGLRTADTEVVHDTEGRTALLVTRFDRTTNRKGDTHPIAQEDACQVLGLYPAAKYRLKTEQAITGLARACADGGGSAAAATLDLLTTVAFSWLIGNGDLHGKNLSIFAPDDFWQPTPAYDLLTTQPYSGWRDPMAMNLYGRANRLTRTHFIESGVRLGLRARAVERMLTTLVAAFEPWPGRCGEIGFDDAATERLSALLEHRRTTLR
ncbi:type II toxin-antitoxin system HipA family toxin [Gordonia sp. TBRC 11910]|uniref:Type II toxin-antitoxin system HipA family toxin n=1 Tax=Gordonia asplenii TaxID=2725283 RepID=A0A848KQY5_9ACTN|nr:HipA domain-containing protein [Gordonia asplenii]NMO01116.1 type II toxin-antitoxin system HipA family toxin [Gordonia asplenii]